VPVRNAERRKSCGNIYWAAQQSLRFSPASRWLWRKVQVAPEAVVRAAVVLAARVAAAGPGWARQAEHQAAAPELAQVAAPELAQVAARVPDPVPAARRPSRGPAVLEGLAARALALAARRARARSRPRLNRTKPAKAPRLVPELAPALAPALVRARKLLRQVRRSRTGQARAQARASVAAVPRVSGPEPAQAQPAAEERRT
jgi:hypothetical protein